VSNNEGSNVVSLEDLDLTAGSEQAFELELVSPKTEKPMGVFIMVLGDNAPSVQKFLRKHINKARQEDVNRTKRGRDDEVRLIEDDVDFAIQSCVVRTVGWRNIKEEFNEENARKLFTKNPLIRRQVLDASNNAANFTKV
jgi:hypothetical protein